MSKTLHIWLAKFKARKDYITFFNESYSDSNDDEPINEFARSQDISFYDHDWLETYFDEDSLGQAHLISSNVPNNYVAAVNLLAKKNKIEDANAICLFYEAWKKDPKSQASDPALWYLGEFNKNTLATLMPKVEFDRASIPDDWWTEFPGNDSELEALQKQSRKRKGHLPAVAKLGVMYISGHYVEQDKEISTKYFNRVRPYPEILSDCLVANGKAGDGEAWFQLFAMYADEVEKKNPSMDREVVLGYLENSAELNCRAAQHRLASILMYSWKGSSYKLKTDYKRAEKILLNIVDQHDSGEYELYCLYSMKDSEIANPKKAFHWLSIHATKFAGGGTTSRMANAFENGDGVEQNKTQMCKWLFLTCCQNNEGYIRYHKDALDLCSREEIEEGRLLGRQWIEDYGKVVEHFEGEKHDPFSLYLQERA